MKFIAEYAMPIACALLVTIFFISLPDLRTATLRCDAPDRRRLTRADALIMALIALAYAGVAFWKLGSTRSPQTFADMRDRTAVVELTGGGEVCSLGLYTGVGIGEYTVEYAPEGGGYYPLAFFTQTHADVLKWCTVALDAPVSGGTLRITGSGNVWLGELVCFDWDAVPQPMSCSLPPLCDEQELACSEQDYMNSSYFDEIYHARTAWEHLNEVEPYEITHPPLGKLIISLGISLFGMTPFGWRFSGTLFGVLMLPVMYIFIKKLFGGRLVPAAGTLVFATDFMHFVQTRIATIDTYSVFFILLMYLFMYLYVSEHKLRYLALSGLFFGLGAASKWTCLYAGAGLAVIWFFYVLTQAKHGRLSLRSFAGLVGLSAVFFVLVPALIYCAAYYPYAAARGHIRFFSPEYFRIVLDNQSYMFNYHSTIVAEHPYSSRWYQWILDVRPILYYLRYFPDGTRSSFGAFVNPALCWGGLLSLFVLIYLAVAKRDGRVLFILAGYLAQLLPWVFVSRLTFEYHYFPSTVFLVLALSCVFELYRLNSRHWKYHVLGFTLLSAALFVLFYPALSGKPVNNELATHLLGWLPTWPF